VTPYDGVELTRKAACLIDMVQHQFADFRGIATPRRRQKFSVCRDVRFAQLLVRGMGGLIAHSHQVAQQMIDDLAHEAQHPIGIGRGEDVMEV